MLSVYNACIQYAVMGMMLVVVGMTMASISITMSDPFAINVIYG